MRTHYNVINCPKYGCEQKIYYMVFDNKCYPMGCDSMNNDNVCVKCIIKSETEINRRLEEHSSELQ